jgi:Protein of unknown function (DUF3037)
MEAAMQCEFFLLRYVPDAVKDEFVNIGVLLFDGNTGYAGVRFTSDWARVRCLDSEADVEVLQSLEADFKRQLANGAAREVVGKMEDLLSNTLQITPAKAVLTDSPENELGRLATYYLDRKHPGRKPRRSVRQGILSQMRGAFEQAGVWKALDQNIPASRYTRPGDPLKIDCGYQPNGVVHLFQAVALSTEPDTAKVLAFTYPLLAQGISRERRAKMELTAIVENEIDRDDGSLQFAAETLESSGIRIVAVRDMPAVAERVRIDLRM